MNMRSAVPLLAVLISNFIFAQSSKPVQDLQVARTLGVTGQPQYAVMSIGRLSTWMRFDGQSNHSPSGDDGIYFPKNTGSAVYQDGLVWGAKVFLDAEHAVPYTAGGSYNIRVGGGTYNVGTRAGSIITPGLGPSGVEPTTDAAVRIFRIRRDYYDLSTEDLRDDAAAVYEIAPASVTTSQMENVRAQYAVDWQQWPVGKGAPYIERNGTPGYQPPPSFGDTFHVADLVTGEYDEPGVAGADDAFPADQVIWTVYHDLSTTQAASFAGSQPLGLELQRTSWAYRRMDDLGNVVFHRYRLINKGGVAVSPENTYGAFYLDSVYLCQWSDPDVGNAGDDLVGCDTSLSLGYAYNANAQDAEYQTYSLPPPAVGYDFLAGPMVPAAPGDSAVFDLSRRFGYKNLPMSSFSYFSAGSPYTDPPSGAANYLLGTGRWWKMLRGYAPVGDLSTSDVPYASPPGMPATPFQFSGDPVAGSGRLDGLATNYSFAPGDRRILLSTGPFRMAPGDTQEVVVALLAGLGADRLSSVAMLRFVDQYAQLMYDRLFALPDLPVVAPEVSFPSPTEATVVLTANDPRLEYQSIEVSLTDAAGIVKAVVTLFDDGAHADGAASDGRFVGALTLARQGVPLAMRVHFQPAIGSGFSVVQAGPEVVTSGRVRVTAVNISFDNLGRDGKLSAGEYARFTPFVENQTPFELTDILLSGPAAGSDGNTGLGEILLPTLAPWGSVAPVDLPPTADGSFTILVPPDWSASTFPCAFLARDGVGNTWADTFHVPVVPAPTRPPYWSAGTGPSGGRVEFMVRDSAGGVIAFPARGAYRSTDLGLTWSKIADNRLAGLTGASVLHDGTIVVSSPRGVYRSSDLGTSWELATNVYLTASTAGPEGSLYGRSSISEFCVSDDGGQTWMPRSTLSYGAPLPSSHQIVFDGDGRIFSVAGGSVDRSLDTGRTWTSVYSSTSPSLRLGVRPDNMLVLGTDSTLAISTDHGATWQTPVLAPVPRRFALITFGPLGEIYASAGQDDSLCYASTNDGASWDLTTGTFSRSHAIIALTPDVILGSARGTPIRSTDGGLTWSASNDGMTAVTVYDLVAVADGILAATDRGLYRSQDGGAMWSTFGQGLPVLVTKIDAGPGSFVMAIAGESLFRSTNGGATWEACPEVSPDSLAETPISLAISDGGSCYVGLSRSTTEAGVSAPTGRILRSTNEGLNWSIVHSQSGAPVSVDRLATWGETVAASIGFGIVVSTDGGTTWPPLLEHNFTQASALAFEPSGTLMAGFGPLLLVQQTPDAPLALIDGTGMRVPLRSGRISVLSCGITGEIIAGSSPDLRSSTGESGVFRSTDGGWTFENVSAGLGLGQFASVTSLVSVPTGGFLAGTIGEGLYRSASLTKIEPTVEGLPGGFRLDSNFPNPFNPSTRIRFAIDKARTVSMKVYSILGQEVATLVDETLPPGDHERSWSGRDASGRVVSSGIYLLRVVSGDFNAVRKMILVR